MELYRDTENRLYGGLKDEYFQWREARECAAREGDCSWHDGWMGFVNTHTSRIGLEIRDPQAQFDTIMSGKVPTLEYIIVDERAWCLTRLRYGIV